MPVEPKTAATIQVSREYVAAKDAKAPGYLSLIESIATSHNDTHYVVPREEYQAIWRRYLRSRGVSDENRRKPIALGDAVERMLTGIGITKERVQAWTRTKDCGCAARQRWLNQWGYKKQEQLERLLKKAARWYGIS